MTVLVLIILGLATYRVSRFFVIDSLLSRLRDRFHNFLLSHKQNTLYELTSCTWCFSVHIAWLLYAGWTRLYPWQFGVNGWIIAGAIAGLSGLLQAWEPDES
jgi:hypothetical protein